MRKYITFILIFITALGCAEKKNYESQKPANDIVWSEGIAFRNGNAIYFDPNKLYTIEFYVSKEYLTNKKNYQSIFPGGRIGWTQRTNLVYVYSVIVTNFIHSVIDSEKILSYKVSNEAIYLKDETTDWEKMEFRLIQTNPEPDIEFRIYLKSKWFEGEYDIPEAG